ncbi:MAG: hypothetical protein ACTIKD_09120 [Sphingobacteriaceae bacterium]
MRNIIFFLLLATLSVSAQDTVTYDIVQMNNGDQRSGKVNEISDSEIKFSYANESLVYILKKTDINKITFATGRIEFFNPGTDKATPNQSLEDFHNKVAILPFAYIVDRKDGGHEMPLKIQKECYDLLNSKAKNIEIQDPQVTNALLGKAGVNDGNIQAYTMGEICHILNVEYSIQGMVTINEADVVSSSYGSVKGESNTTIGKWLNTSATSYSTKNYDTNMVMNMYDNQGQRLFGQNHDSIWPMVDAYQITLKYLLKKVPVWGK